MSRVLVIGGTGYMGKHIISASVRLGHPTFVLVRESSASDPAKAQLLNNFKASGVNLVYGDMHDHDSLLKAIKQVDVVISTVSRNLIAEQTRIIKAIKEAGNVKRFLPSEFGNDPDRSHAVEPVRTAYNAKSKIRRAAEAEGIPYTFVCSNFFAGFSLRTLAQPGATGLPTEKINIMGDGNTKAVYVDEEDIGTYTIKAIDDTRTLNKIVYIRPPTNIVSHNELVSLYERKTGKTLQKIYLSEKEVFKKIKESPPPVNLLLAIYHSVFIKDDQMNFKIDPSFGEEASQLYPDVKYTTVEEVLCKFL